MCQEIVSVIKDVAVAGAAIVAAWVGCRGLHTWRRQLKGKTEYELAIKVLTTSYELRDAIASVRNPFMQYPQEPDLPEEKLRELSRREKEWHAFAQARQRMWEPVTAARAKLDASSLEAEAVWGREIKEKINVLNGLLGELFCAIREQIEERNPNNRADDSPDAEAVLKRRKIMYSRQDCEKDEYQMKLANAIRAIEDELRPHIVRHHS